MTPKPFDRGKARRFAQLLDEAEGGRRHHLRTSYDDELAPMIHSVEDLSAVGVTAEPDTAPTPEFRSDLRAMLMATIEREGIGATAKPVASRLPAVRQPSPPLRARTRFAIALGVTAGALALSGMSAASGDAVPGDALYSVKRSTERAQLALASTDVNRGQLYLGFARTRLGEARSVRPNSDALGHVLADMDGETREGVRQLTTAAVDRRDPAGLDAVETFVTVQRRDLVDLLSQLRDLDRTRVLGSLALLDDVSRRAAGLRTTLLCTATGGGQLDALGPRPKQCTALPAPGATAGSPSGPKASRGSRPAGTGQSAVPGPGTPADPANPADPGAPGNPQPTGGPSSTPTPSPSQGGGLVDDLGRIIGNLLR